ncbi:MAG: Uma2 family endonuclease [Deltaproteobacteria bacterium]|nr:Uma2 family endonuclease [Deltaproteobacteria bacterium]
MLESTPDISIDYDALITEDDTPVDNIPSEKQQRLLTEPLYSSWQGPGEQRPFLAAANIGVFSQTELPAIVPDVFLSLDVAVARDWWLKKHRSYFIWDVGKPPDLVIEIVSNTVGNENGEKRKKYAWMRVPFYVIYDPRLEVMEEALTVYELRDLQYERRENRLFACLKLGLTLWEGEFEGKVDTWLRWTDEQGKLIPTGKERAEQADQRAEQADQRAEQERLRAEQADQRAEQADQRAEHLAALLRQAGIVPDQK